MAVFELISNHLCPYTQRAAIQLGEKGQAYTHRYIDLADKPAWFLAISPLGKVPVLRVNGQAVFETSAICECLEELLPAPALLPAEALARARQRAWCEFASALIGEVFGFYMAPDATALERQRAQLALRLARLDEALASGGSFFDGPAFQLVDAAFAPVFRLFDTFDRIGDFGWWSGLARVPAYRAALAGRASVQQAVVPDYALRFEHYLHGRDSELARRMGITH